MSDVRDSFLDLEKHRLRLEDNATKLRKALQHWQTWDAEYEALKEEVEAVSATDEDEIKELRRIRDEFEGDLLNGKEVDEIFALSNTRTKDQITNVLERRIDYVTKNIETLQKQLETAENKFAAATVISQPDATDEEGQPITDIVEELDEDDNVISVHLNKPGESISHVQSLLDKAGISDAQNAKSEPGEKILQSSVDHASSTAPTKTLPDPKSEPKPEPSESETVIKKAVSFSDDTKPVEEPKPNISWRAKRVEQIMNTAKDQENTSKDSPVLPPVESAEDAALRQQMLKYSMSEVGAVVAELELDADADSEEFTDEGFDEELDEDGEDEEDEYGRYKGSVITDKYRERMLELQKKHGFTSGSSQPKVDEHQDSGDDNDEGIGRIVVNRERVATSSSKISKATPTKSILKEKPASDIEEKKGVRFAPSLDIASDSEPSELPRAEPKDLVEPLSDIVERKTPPRPVEPPVAKKASRFKKSRDNVGSASVVPKGPLDVRPVFTQDDDDRPLVPTGPEGTTIADTLVERESASSAIPPDQLNDMATHHEVANEYQRMRKKFIQREGGFLRPDESAVEPIYENEDSQEPISRFKAARLSRQ